tara:strand:+ start:907 stop:2775 length:1869 start_codon:yes stop_codon:yes gene_type:complete
MCGIYGFSLKKFSKNPKSVLKKMSEKIYHRGPDQTGLYIDDNVAMGIQRLSILDIKNGTQPIYSNNKRYVIVHNGEVYNYLKLKNYLQKKGYQFETNTDTEVIVNLFQHKGKKCLNDLNGMFAFAIYDLKKKEIFIGRDRYGIKPIYFYYDVEQFIFASELKGILCHESVKPSISPDSIDLYLTMEYVPSPYTIFNDIYKLEKGHFLLYDNSKLKKEKWYDISFTPKLMYKKEIDYINKLDNLMKDSVRFRTISDVSIGCFLSGGLDSSLITYYLSEISKEKVKTFSIGFEDYSFDETNYANIISKHFDTDHNSETFSESKMFELLPNVWKNMDEPFADPSLLPTFLLSHFTNQQVKVCLSGDGADEIFAGYPTYLAHKIASLIPKQLYSLISQTSSFLPVRHRNMSFDFKLRQFSRGLRYRNKERHQYWLGSFKNNEKQKNYLKYFKDSLSNKNNLKQILKQNSNELKDWEINLEQDFNFYLTDDMLVKIDRTSMANSLEVRVPYLDHNIVEFMVKCPSKLKYHGITSKYLLKQLAKKYLPHEVVNRSKKGFGIPIAKWFCGSLKKPLREILRNPNSFINTIFEKGYTNQLMENHFQKKQNNGKMLWTLFTLENWYNNNDY